tara:strand:+ start:236888 stop:238759 length:1872 start_codon:yes stop_codon:yes gene_type:complete
MASTALIQRTLMLTLLLGGLAGCASAPQPPPTPIAVPVEPSTALETQNLALELPESIHEQDLYSAEQALNQFDWMSASITLDSLPTSELNANDRAYIQYLRARIAYVRGDQDKALELLEALENTSPSLTSTADALPGADSEPGQASASGLHPAIEYRVLNFHRYQLAMSGKHLQSARMGDQLLRMAPESDQAALRRQIWRELSQIDDDALNSATTAAADPQWRGWLQLAAISRQTGSSLVTNIFAWRSENPQHPAAIHLPGGLAYMLADSSSTDRVALLLPLSGRLAPVGKAVRDGYLSAYYAARGRGDETQPLLVLDSDQFVSTVHAYETAVEQGATLVIGPLSKEAVGEIGLYPFRPVPLLALNRADRTLPPGGAALVQLSLAPEDDANRIAELAFGRGARSAIVIRPAGRWGDEVSAALGSRWRELGGRIADEASYSSRENYSASIKEALDLAESEQRGRNIRDILAANIELTPRRRQDADVIFLLSRSGSEARSIKPLMAFHYAGDLPVYALSSIYSGIPDSRDRDLNGIQLAEIPWLMGANPELRVAIAAGNTGSDAFPRLNALGAEAFKLQTGFSRLQAGPDVLLRGNTGLLSMNPQLQIERQPELATFEEGILARP